MSDGQWQTDSQEQTGHDGAQMTAGQLLKAAREAQGLHIAALAVSLKVPVKKLEFLEADRLDELPDAVFVRALASSMCRSLKVDATEILAKLPQTNKPRLSHVEQSINTPFRMPNDAAPPGALTALSRPAVLGVMALLLAALVLIFLPYIQQKTSSLTGFTMTELKSSFPSTAVNGDTNTSGTAMGAGSVLTTDGGVRAATTGAGDTQPTAQAPVEQSRITASNINAGQSSTAVISPTLATPTMATPIPTSTPAASGNAQGMVVFRAKGETWVEVIDVNSRVVLRKLLLPGESVGATGLPPLRVTVGRADQTIVMVRGAPFDGESLVRDNVLRFEVK